MNEQQIKIVNEITRLALAGSERLGKRIYHEVIAWPSGDVWSYVRVIEGDCELLHGSEVIIRRGDDTVPGYDTGDQRMTLVQQRDGLVNYIATQLQEAA